MEAISSSIEWLLPILELNYLQKIDLQLQPLENLANTNSTIIPCLYYFILILFV